MDPAPNTNRESPLAPMESDPIIEEIHAIREALSKASGEDIRKIAEAATARHAESGRKAVRLAPREIKAAGTAS